jgi:hypothetical protein
MICSHAAQRQRHRFRIASEAVALTDDDREKYLRDQKRSF